MIVGCVPFFLTKICLVYRVYLRLTHSLKDLSEICLDVRRAKQLRLSDFLLDIAMNVDHSMNASLKARAWFQTNIEFW